MKAVSKGFEGFKEMLTRLVKDAIEHGELPPSLNSDTIAESLFAGMLGTSVLYGVDKDITTLDHSIDSLIEYVYMLNNMQMPDSVGQSESI
jgi:hypothetical protein